jgi:hypothetical protein
MTNHDPATAIQKLLPHAEARQETLRLLAHANHDYQARYEDCRHAVSYAYDALSQNATQANPLPPDPEGMNNDRAEWAGAALRQFRSVTGTDFEDALSDLLGDLMHWADRNGVTFDDQLSCARMHYEAETAADDPEPGAAAEAAPDNRPPDPVPSDQTPTPALTSYRAEFFTAADYAFRTFEAETPAQALLLARQFYDEDGDLDFRSYDDSAALDQIQIWDSKRGTLARWESDDYRLRKAASESHSANLLFIEWIDSGDRGFPDSDKLDAAVKAARGAIAKAQNREVLL